MEEPSYLGSHNKACFKWVQIKITSKSLVLDNLGLENWQKQISILHVVQKHWEFKSTQVDASALLLT